MYIGFSTVYRFRHPLGVWGCIPMEKGWATLLIIFIEHLLYSRHSSKHFAYMNPFNLPAITPMSINHSKNEKTRDRVTFPRAT